MKKYIKLFEEFDRPEDLIGFKLVKKIPTVDFMDMISKKTFEHGKQYVYRLVNYIPRTEVTYSASGEMAKPIVKGDKKSVKAVDNAMYTSPFIIFPYMGTGKYCNFIENEDGTLTRYNGKSEKKIKLCKKLVVSYFSAISISAFFGNRTPGGKYEMEDTDFIKLTSLLQDVFDDDLRHESWIKSTRNYTGYIFDEVYVYEIEDPEEAAETIIDECDVTVV